MTKEQFNEQREHWLSIFPFETNYWYELCEKVNELKEWFSKSPYVYVIGYFWGKKEANECLEKIEQNRTSFRKYAKEIIAECGGVVL